MIKQNEIFESIKYVVDNSKNVKINKNNIENIIPYLNKKANESWLDFEYLDLDKCTNKEIIMYLILCESLNFCYWGSNPKWKIEYKGKWYSGSYGLFYSVAKAIKNGYDLLNIEYLEKIDIDKLDEIFKGTTSIPLLKERFDILKQLTKELKKIEDIESLFNVSNDVELLNEIINNFSNFRDISNYKGKDIYFFKRAILLVGDLISNVEYIKEKVNNDDNMLGCADYKIPQVLRHLDILEYSKELSTIVDNEELLKHDSEMEIEIRASMLYAIELIKEKLVSMNSVQIDNALWLLSKNDDFKNKPYHLTETIYY
jgi:Protein of unknown function (DUF2419).